MPRLFLCWDETLTPTVGPGAVSATGGLRSGNGSEEIGEHLAEFGREHRFVEDAVDLKFLIRLVDARAELGAENQHLAVIGKLAHAGDELDAVDVRHVVVGDDEIVGVGIGGDAIERLLAVADAFNQVSLAAEGDASDLAQFAHVVRIENTQKFFRKIDLVVKHCRWALKWARATGPSVIPPTSDCTQGSAKIPRKKSLSVYQEEPYLQERRRTDPRVVKHSRQDPGRCVMRRKLAKQCRGRARFGLTRGQPLVQRRGGSLGAGKISGTSNRAEGRDTMPRLMKTSLKLVALLALGVVGVLSLPTGCAGTATRQSTGEYVDDAAITAKVKTALVRDEVVKAMQVDVTTFKGNVQLAGFVDTEEQKSRAAMLAAGVEGVTNVTNNISIKGTAE